MAELAPEVPVEQSPLAIAEPLANAEPLAAEEPPAADLAIAEPPAASLATAEPAAADLAAAEPTPLSGATMPAVIPVAETSRAETAMAAAPAGPAAGGDAPVSLLPSTPAGLQTASLTVGAIDDMTFLRSEEHPSELQSLM